MIPRIRTVKPEFFRHEELYELEKETGLPIRLAFIGLWCCCDREGRFQWRPKTLKIMALPFDDVDFSRVLDALATRGFVCSYASGTGEKLGYIPSWSRHQYINNREARSSLQAPSNHKVDASGTRHARVVDGKTVSSHGNGNGNYKRKTPLPPVNGGQEKSHDELLKDENNYSVIAWAHGHIVVRTGRHKRVFSKGDLESMAGSSIESVLDRVQRKGYWAEIYKQ
jgi:hypothetical protein